MSVDEDTLDTLEHSVTECVGEARDMLVGEWCTLLMGKYKGRRGMIRAVCLTPGYAGNVYQLCALVEIERVDRRGFIDQGYGSDGDARSYWPLSQLEFDKHEDVPF